MHDIAVCALVPARIEEATAWATRYHLTIVDDATPCAWCLCFTATHIELRQHGTSPIRVDFVDGRLGYRRVHGGGKRQPLARAIGIKDATRPHVLDCTAGLGRDAMVLANLGCTVTLVERSPIIAALLEDGLRRALANPATADLAARMHLHGGCEAVAYMQALAPQDYPDVVYLDPMYPHREKSALVKKDMRALRAVVGDDMDAPNCLHWAMRIARRRVVVKRPKGAPTLDATPPQASIHSDNTRYDLYFAAI
ncbi:MAG: class I SAM-dependent methyltransferase [Pseudomonadota bacterium]